MKKLISIILCFSIVFSFTTITYASKKAKKFPREIKMYYSKNKYYNKEYVFINSEKTKSKCVIKNLKVSNKKVLKTKKTHSYSGGCSIDINIKKTGTTTINGKLYTKSGKFLFKLKQKIKIIKYNNSFVYFKVGDVDYTKYFDNESQPNLFDSNTIKGKVNIKLKKGYESDRIEFSHSNKGTWSGGKKIKNGTFVTCKDLYNEICVYYTHKKYYTEFIAALFLNK